MNRKIFLLSLLIVLGSAACAQVSKGNFWVIEGNSNKPNFTIVRVYDQENKLLEEKRIEGRLLNIANRRDRKFLDKIVRDVVADQKQSAITKNQTK